MPARLPYDILVKIAEKLMFSSKTDWVVDMQSVENFGPMFASRLSLRSLFLQFRRMAELSCNGDGQELLTPVHLRNQGDGFFRGPFKLSDWFFFWALAGNVLRLKRVSASFQFFRPSGHFSSHDSTDVAEEPPAESLVRLVLFQDSPDCMKRAWEYDLSDVELLLELVKFSDSPFLFGQFDRVLNLNAVRYEIDIRGTFEEFVVPSLGGVVGDRVEDINIDYHVESISDSNKELMKFSPRNLRTLIRIALSSCSALKRFRLRIDLQGEFISEDFEPIAQWMIALNKQLAGDILMDIQTDCEVVVAFRAFFNETTLADAVLDRHEVTRIGEPYGGTDWEEEENISPIFISRQEWASPSCTLHYRLAGNADADDQVPPPGQVAADTSDDGSDKISLISYDPLPESDSVDTADEFSDDDFSGAFN